MKPSPILKSLHTNLSRQHQDPNGTHLESILEPTDAVLMDSASSSIPVIPGNKNGKRYSLRQIFQVWYDNENAMLADIKCSPKSAESYKVAKPAPIYHLVLQDNAKEAEQEKDLEKSVQQLSVEGARKPATMPPPNLPVPTPQKFLDPTVKLVQPFDIQWLYLDPSGNEQGPFSGDVMQEWLTEGYLNFDLRIRRREESLFQKLSEFCDKLQNFTYPFKVPLPMLETPVESASPSALNPVTPFHDATMAATVHTNGIGGPVGGAQSFQHSQTSNGSQSAFGAPLYSQLMPNGLPSGGLGAANMRMLSSSHLFDYLNNDYLLMNQQQFPVSNQFGIDPGMNQSLGGQGLGGQNLGGQNLGSLNIGGQNLGAQNIGGGFGQLHMLSLLQQTIKPQPLLSRNSSTWGVDSTLVRNNTGGLNPLLSQPNPISPWLTGMQSASRVNSPFVPSSTLATEPAKVDDHVLHDLHSSMVTGILNDDKEEFIGQVVPEPESHPEVAPPIEFKEEIVPIEAQVESPIAPFQTPKMAETEPQVEQEVKPAPVPEAKPEKVTKVVPEEPLQPALAPWAASTNSSSAQPKQTLKEIQQLEAERLQKERQLKAEMRQEQATLANSFSSHVTEEKPAEKVTFNWTTTSQSIEVPKTLAEIQKEEVEARAKSAKFSGITGVAVTKPSLATSLANTIPREDFSAWTTVASKKTVPKKAATQTFTSSPAHSSLSPQMLRAASSTSIIGNTINNNAVKEDFMVWARSTMTNLYPSVSKDELLEIFTTLPVHSDSAQLISETIYSSSATMDGRRFAQEFMKRRHQVEKQLGPGDNGSWSAAISTSADKIPAVDDDGWSTSVKSKKKGKKN